jgi:carbamoyl-phosphate synthase large subunit
MKRLLRAGISALNAVDNPGPGIPVIRCLKESTLFDVDVVGLAYDALEPGIYMQGMASTSYLMPYPLTGFVNMLERIREIHAQQPLNLIIPVLDSELVAYIRMQDHLRAMGIATYLPTMENIDMRSKANLSAFGAAHAIPVPKTRVVHNPAQLPGAAAEFTYPLMVKGVFYDAVTCWKYDEVVQAFGKLSKKWGMPVILQEHVTGDEYNIAAVGDGTGETVGAVISKKVYITDKGKGWSGVSIRNDELMHFAQTIIRHLKWRGALELEMMRTEANGLYSLLEINPRFPAWVYLSAGVGINLPEMLVSLALGDRPAQKLDYEAGKMFLRYSAELIIDMQELEQITITSRYVKHDRSHV